jgi:hypothetical protein
MLRAHRAIEVGELDEMVEVLACCQGPRWPTGRRIAVMTASGGQAELILDLATAAGLHLPPLSDDARGAMQRSIGTLTGDGNPLDAWGNGTFVPNLDHSLAALQASPDHDAILFLRDNGDDQPMDQPETALNYLRQFARAAAAGITGVAQRGRGRSADVPSLGCMAAAAAFEHHAIPFVVPQHFVATHATGDLPDPAGCRFHQPRHRDAGRRCRTGIAIARDEYLGIVRDHRRVLSPPSTGCHRRCETSAGASAPAFPFPRCVPAPEVAQAPHS